MPPMPLIAAQADDSSVGIVKYLAWPLRLSLWRWEDARAKRRYLSAFPGLASSHP